jgi:hypothetical protein
MFIYKWLDEIVGALMFEVSKIGQNVRRLFAIRLIPLVIVFSCGSKALPSFNQINLDVWKEDKLGCLGKREGMLDAIDAQTEKLLALDEREIISLLGRPDENELYKRNQKFYYYFIQPSKKCSDSVNNNPKRLVIRFNAIGLAKEVAVE